MRIRRGMVQICKVLPARALNKRPYIHDGKSCDFAGKQWEFVIVACREAERLPYDIHGRLCGFAGGAVRGWRGDYPSVSFADSFADSSPDKGSLGAERIRRWGGAHR